MPWHKGKTGVYSNSTLENWSKKRKGSKNPHSKEWNEKIRKSNKGQGLGRKLSKETRKRISLGLKGKVVSEKTRKKISESQKGPKHWNWKGGSEVNNVIRRSSNYIKWQKACLKRDCYKNQKPSISGGRLEVHHILSFADYPELRFEISNGVTLSQKAHKEFHKKYGRKNNTREQLSEFLRD